MYPSSRKGIKLKKKDTAPHLETKLSQNATNIQKPPRGDRGQSCGNSFPCTHPIDHTGPFIESQADSATSTLKNSIWAGSYVSQAMYNNTMLSDLFVAF